MTGFTSRLVYTLEDNKTKQCYVDVLVANYSYIKAMKDNIDFLSKKITTLPFLKDLFERNDYTIIKNLYVKNEFQGYMKKLQILEEKLKIGKLLNIGDMIIPLLKKVFKTNSSIIERKRSNKYNNLLENAPYKHIVYTLEDNNTGEVYVGMKDIVNSEKKEVISYISSMKKNYKIGKGLEYLINLFAENNYNIIVHFRTNDKLEKKIKKLELLEINRSNGKLLNIYDPLFDHDPEFIYM